MSAVKDSLLDCIGQTPLVRANRVQGEECKATLLFKLESENPGKSVKDRIGLSMILQNEAKGVLTPGKSVLIEATSGNTGIALAMIGAARGYHVILTMPETMSLERRCLLKAYGAEIVLTPASKGVKGAMYKAEQLAKEIEHGFLTEQFASEFNPLAHEKTTGPEIWSQTDGRVNVLVSGVGTGGTLTGCSRYFQSQGGKVKCVAVEPAESAVLSGETPGPHKIQGLGAGFKPHTLDLSCVDEIIRVPGEDAMTMGRRMAQEEGIFCGISSGAIVHAAIQVAQREESAGQVIVVIIPSYGERYLSSAMYSELTERMQNLPVASAEECTPPEGWTCAAFN